jgi:putative tricarboxylic transport membrane protein
VRHPRPAVLEDAYVQVLSSKRNRDYIGGALMTLLGLGTVLQGMSYSIGTVRRMGPGFFPVALGVILALVGIAIIVSARFAVYEGEETPLPPEWRGWFCIGLSIVAFVVLGKYGGLLPATFAIVFISALGDRENSLKSAVILSLAIIVVCLVVFSWALQMQFPLIGWGG